MSIQTSIDSATREAPRRRPRGKPAGFHHWSELLFVHWRAPAEQVQALLPRGLTVDTWDGAAWIGLVLFQMSGVRPRWFPALPGVSAFLETNVRTYAHLNGQAPGVYFFSLDAANSLAVRVARWRWRLPYFRARMQVRREADRVSYRSRRLWPGLAGASSHIEAEISQPLGAGEPAREAGVGHAAADTLEFFLAERYLMYVQAPHGLLRGQVHHAPYPLRRASLRRCDESLLAAAGLRAETGPCHAMYCAGVQVEIFPLLDVGPMSFS